VSVAAEKRVAFRRPAATYHRLRRNPDVISGSRKRRIAAGSGTQIQDIGRLLKQHKQMQKMMKKVSGKGGMAKLMRGMGGMGGGGGGGMLPPGGGMPRF
jgi:signal recognition particle subunit SRP54